MKRFRNYLLRWNGGKPCHWEGCENHAMYCVYHANTYEWVSIEKYERLQQANKRLREKIKELTADRESGSHG